MKAAFRVGNAVLHHYYSKKMTILNRSLSTSATLYENSSKISINVNGGTLLGRTEPLPVSGKYFIFQGIPYAHPPTGPDRFQPAKPIGNFNGKQLDCTKEGDICLQPDMFSKQPVGSEDCLYLNVYTPTISKSDKLPVMVFIHGGAFIMESGSSDIRSPEFLVQEDVIVVTFNYRLNVLGFLHLPEGGINGNQGLRDQRVAFQWVKENIEQFGGDSNNITLFSHSAGSSAAHLHMLLPESRKYFNKVILQSGAATMDWFIQHNPEEKARTLAKLLGCKSKKDSEIAEFLKKCPPVGFLAKFQATLTDVEKRRGLPIVFKPVIEQPGTDAFLTESVVELLEKPNTIDMPIMMGITEKDGMVMVGPQLKRVDLWNKEPGRFIPRTVDVDGDTHNKTCKELGDEIKKFYFGDRLVSKETFNQFMEFMTDYNFNIAQQSAAEFHSRFQHPNTNIFYYQFSFDGDLNMMKKILNLDKPGANHGDELTYLFVMKMLEAEIDHNSVTGKMRQKMCRLWTNFAKFSDPTPVQSDPVVGSVKWEPVKRHTVKDKNFQLDCFDIDTECRMIGNPYEDRMKFWRSIYEKYNGSFLKPKL